MNRTQTSQTDVIIIGAGIAGLMAASWLQENGRSVIVVEKDAAVGGRLATAQLENGRADIGAQFFTVREADFQAYVDHWLSEGIVFEWSRGWSDGSLLPSKTDGYPRSAVSQGMSTICKYLAQKVNVHLQTEIKAIHNQGQNWQLTDADGNQFISKALLLTPPMPISLALLDQGDVALSPTDRQQLEQIQFAPCWCAVVAIEGEVDLPHPGALQRPKAIVSWMADNQQKGVSQSTTLITMHINPQKSKLWALAPQNEIEGIFRQAIRPFLTPTSTIKNITVHYWPYAVPTTTHPQRTLLAQKLPPLVFAGDAFNGPRVEGAALSGLAASIQINQILK